MVGLLFFVLSGGGPGTLPAPSVPPDSARSAVDKRDELRHRLTIKVDGLRPLLLIVASAPNQQHGQLPVRWHWLVSAQYGLSDTHSLQLDWLHNGGLWPRRVEGLTLQWRLRELLEEGNNEVTVCYGPLIGYRRLKWPTEYPTVNGQHPAADRLNVGAFVGTEILLTKRRPQLLLEISSAASYQRVVRQNQPYAYAELYKLDRNQPFLIPTSGSVNLDARVALGLRF